MGEGYFPDMRTGPASTRAWTPPPPVGGANVITLPETVGLRSSICPERAFLAERLRRILRSADFVEVMGRPLTPAELSRLWRLAQPAWARMEAGRSTDPEVRLVLRAAVDGHFWADLQSAVGSETLSQARGEASKRLRELHKRQPHLVASFPLDDPLFIPLVLVLCALLHAEQLARSPSPLRA